MKKISPQEDFGANVFKFWLGGLTFQMTEWDLGTRLEAHDEIQYATSFSVLSAQSVQAFIYLTYLVPPKPTLFA